MSYPDWFKNHRTVDYTLTLIALLLGVFGAVLENHRMSLLGLGLIFVVFISQELRWRRLRGSASSPIYTEEEK